MKPAFAALPEVLGQVADAGGLRLADALSKAFGGRRIYVPAPAEIDEDHKIAKGLAAQGLTLKDAQTLAKVLNGWVDVPFGPFAGPKRRRAALARMLDEDMTKAEIAAACEVTERTVYRIQAKPKEPDLFSNEPDSCQGHASRRLPRK